MNKTKLLIAISAALAILPSVTMATEGYFAHGWGARHSALGGAGVASVTDASGQAINPAGLVYVEDDQLNLAASIFNPNRSFEAFGDYGIHAPGKVDSDSNYFLVPNVAYNSRIDENSAWGITMYGNGGMNTDYEAVDGGVMCPYPDMGIFCSGEAGVDMVQVFVALSYAIKMDNISFGISPIFVYHAFEARGLGLFAGSAELGVPPFTSDATALTNNDHGASTGFGVKLGFMAELGDGFTIGASYQPKINMSEFDEYAGLFADQGDFDIPSNLTVGIAFKPSDDVTVLMDYKRINYTDSGAVGNAGDLAAFAPDMFFVPQNPMGSTGGPGFGWDDISIFKVGIEVEQSEDFTWRFGFAHNDNPIGPEDVSLNVLAPGVVTSHFTTGFKMGLEDNGALEFFLVYVPTESVSGDAMFNPMFDMYDPETGALVYDTPDQTIEVEMDQLIFGVSWTMAFGG